jgi:putative spermidine/putrescine transport system substrate-binding protein
MDRRHFLKGSVAVATATALGGLLEACGLGSGSGSPTVADNRLIIGYDASSFRDWLDQIVTTPFEAKYGATVAYDSSAAEDARIAKAIVSKGHRLDDAMELQTFGDVQKAVSSGILSKLDQSIVTNWKDISPAFRNDYWGTLIASYFGIIYRKDKIPEGITSWFDLWKPAYKGRVALPGFDWYGFNWLIMINHVLGGSASDFSKGAAKIHEYYQQQKPVTITGTDQGVQLFTSGQIWAAPFYDGRARRMQKAGLPVEFVFPDEGADGQADGFGVMALSNFRLANQYINMVMDPDIQIAFARLANYAPTNLRALEKLPSDMQNLIVPQKALDNLLKIDYQTAVNHIDDAQKLWNQVIIG